MNTVQILQKLIQIPSFSGQEEKLAEFIYSFCDKNNLPFIRQKGNIIIRLKGKSQNKALIFNAHMDTVSAGSEKLWKYPPHGKQSGVIKGRKIYGLGAADDKASIAVMLDLAKTVKPEYDLWFTFVCNEETDGSGTENFLTWFKDQKYLAKYKKIVAVIGEPTTLQKIEIGHRGNAFYQLTAIGKTGHSAKSYSKKDLAIQKMLDAIESLHKIFSQWKIKYKDEILGEPIINVTSINSDPTSLSLTNSFSRRACPSPPCCCAGLNVTSTRYLAPVTRLLSDDSKLIQEKPSLNKIPDKCSATIDIRTTPKLHTLINQLIEVSLGSEIIAQRIKSSDPPAVLNKKSQFLKLCKKLFPNLKISVSQGSTDLGQFLKAGIEGIVLGPGDNNTAHTVDEYVCIKNLEKASEMYKKIILSNSKGFTAFSKAFSLSNRK